MKNFFKCVFLGIIALLVPVLLIAVIMKVISSGLMNGIGIIAIGYMIGFTIYWFAQIGKKRACKNREDAFWLTTIFNATVVLILNVAVVLCGWLFVENFTALPFACAPVELSLGYSALLVGIVCVIRLYYNNDYMNAHEKGLTWSILAFAVVFSVCMLLDVSEEYYAVNIPETISSIIAALIVLSVCSIVFFACKLMFKK